MFWNNRCRIFNKFWYFLDQFIECFIFSKRNLRCWFLTKSEREKAYTGVWGDSQSMSSIVLFIICIQNQIIIYKHFSTYYKNLIFKMKKNKFLIYIYFYSFFIYPIFLSKGSQFECFNYLACTCIKIPISSLRICFSCL